MKKSIRFLSISIFIIFSLVSSFAYSQIRDEVNLTVVKGTVSVTPARLIGEQEPTTAVLSGSVVAFLPGGGTQLFFPSSDLTTSPNVNFLLPSDPNVDSNGTTRRIEFTYDQDGLTVSGSIDQRAFDGPLTEYAFTAIPSTDEGFDAKGLYSARSDFRKCAAPLCGGFFIKKLNRAKTRCADGSLRKECYVASANFNSFDISFFPFTSQDSTPYIFRGTQSLEPFKGFGNLGVFEASEAYKAVSNDIASGRFFGLENVGILCITSPCFSYEAHVLNRKRVLDISGFDFSAVGSIEDDVVSDVVQNLADGQVVLLSGDVRYVDGFAGRGREIVATQLYVPILPKRVTIPLNTVCVNLGYSFFDGACRTPFGCEYPLIELTAIGGAPRIDLITGEVTARETKSCVAECDFPAQIQGPGQCSVALP